MSLISPFEFRKPKNSPKTAKSQNFVLYFCSNINKLPVGMLQRGAACGRRFGAILRASYPLVKQSLPVCSVASSHLYNTPSPSINTWEWSRPWSIFPQSTLSFSTAASSTALTNLKEFRQVLC